MSKSRTLVLAFKLWRVHPAISLSYATDTTGVEDARPPRKKFEFKKRVSNACSALLEVLVDDHQLLKKEIRSPSFTRVSATRSPMASISTPSSLSRPDSERYHQFGRSW